MRSSASPSCWHVVANGSRVNTSGKCALTQDWRLTSRLLFAWPLPITQRWTTTYFRASISVVPASAWVNATQWSWRTIGSTTSTTSMEWRPARAYGGQHDQGTDITRVAHDSYGQDRCSESA